jgi:dipeptidyl aminopeptidase/acylaminoacyl peptidase
MARAGEGLWVGGERVLAWAEPIAGLVAAGGAVAFVSPVGPQRGEAILYEDVPVRFWDQHVGPRVPHVFVARPGEDAVDVTPEVGAGLVGMQWDLAPDGARVAAAVRRPDDPLRVSDLVLFGEGEPRVLTASDRAWYEAPRFSPDGRRLLALRRAIGTPDAPAAKTLQRVDAETGAAETVALPSWPTEAAWGPDGELYCVAQVDGFDALLRVGDEVTPLAPGAGHSDLQVTAGGTVFALRSTFTEPPEVVRVDEAVPAAPARGIHRGRAAAPDGTEVPHWLILPEDTSEPAPLIVLGNAYVPFSWTNRWYFRWNPTAYAAEGYAVAMPDLGPSLGYGEDYLARGWGRWTDVSFGDLLATVEAVAADPRVDGTRVGLLGGGWGGWLAAWAAGHTRSFRCVALQGGAWHLPSYLAASDEFDRWEEQLGDDFEALLAVSPSSAAADVRTPALIVAGERDFRAPAADAIGMFRDLRRHGADARLLLMPDEGHRIAKLASEDLWYRTLFAFFGHYLRDEPWARPEGL